MTYIKCTLPSSINLIVGPNKWETAYKEYRGSNPPDLKTLEQDLNRLASTGIPAFVDRPQDDRPLRISFCTERYEIRCGLTSHGDAYYFYRMIPLTFGRCNSLAKRAVIINITADQPWNFCSDLDELNDQVVGAESGIEIILKAWNTISPVDIKEPGSIKTDDNEDSQASQRFISNIEKLIDLARDFEQNSPGKQSIPVREVRPVARERFAGDIYKFIVYSHDFKVGDYLSVGLGDPTETSIGYTGIVTEASEQWLTVKFHTPVDFKILNAVEWLKPLQSFRQYQIQRAALQTLRQGKSKNPYLINVIVNGTFLEQNEAVGEIKLPNILNDSQMRVVNYANKVSDMLLVIGPPGTGKTSTIREIVKQYAGRRQRVLITSKNNKAVDNVLEGLIGVNAVRIGREEAISSEIQGLMIDVKAYELQNIIRQNVMGVMVDMKYALELWPQISIFVNRLESMAIELQNLIRKYLDEEKRFIDWKEERNRFHQSIIERYEQDRVESSQEIKQTNFNLERARERIAFFSSASKLFLIGGLFSSTRDKAKASEEELAKGLWRAQRKYEKASQEKQIAINNLDRDINQSEESYKRTRTVEIAKRQKEDGELAISKALDDLFSLLSRIKKVPSLLKMVSVENLIHIAGQLKSWHRQIEPRYSLLTEWIEMLRSRHQALYPTLIRMADVVGATCIGIATDARFEDLDFDLVIADEAGQIQVMDLLVPLTRAKKAVLVGDHQQLPPFFEKNLIRLGNLENNELLDWMSKSLFETIIRRGNVPENRLLMLDTQYRMPKLIAEFISKEFYENKYKTAHETPHHDPFFDHPLAFIDTIRIPNRRERREADPAGEVGSYTNTLEAQIIIELILDYDDQHKQWGVIVPYAKQAELIRQGLRAYLPVETLNNWVATVDSFQGKEKDVIIYGFTRSNSKGNIGFLAELRRLNVSLTRARHQLILVGDSGFLTQTYDNNFSGLIKRLLKIVKEDGVYLYADQLKYYLATRKATL
jgi:hypothetical protein